jgi:anaerobic selenocysteine-containing dehydrogenase
VSEKKHSDGLETYGAKHLEVLQEAPESPPPTGFRRRTFLGVGAAGAAGLAVAGCSKKSEPGAAKQDPQALSAPDRPVAGPNDNVAPPEKDVPTDILAQCPYCGVGCGTLIQTEKGRIVGMKPDPKHPTNKGLQCIKGLTSAEAIYVDRLTKPLIRKDQGPLRQRCLP